LEGLEKTFDDTAQSICKLQGDVYDTHQIISYAHAEAETLASRRCAEGKRLTLVAANTTALKHRLGTDEIALAALRADINSLQSTFTASTTIEHVTLSAAIKKAKLRAERQNSLLDTIEKHVQLADSGVDDLHTQQACVALAHGKLRETSAVTQVASCVSGLQAKVEETSDQIETVHRSTQLIPGLLEVTQKIVAYVDASFDLEVARQEVSALGYGTTIAFRDTS
jgi:hypothetical protein